MFYNNDVLFLTILSRKNDNLGGGGGYSYKEINRKQNMKPPKLEWFFPSYAPKNYTGG